MVDLIKNSLTLSLLRMTGILSDSGPPSILFLMWFRWVGMFIVGLNVHEFSHLVPEGCKFHPQIIYMDSILMMLLEVIRWSVISCSSKERNLLYMISKFHRLQDDHWNLRVHH